MLNEIMDYLGIAGTNKIWLLVIGGIVILQFIFAVYRYVSTTFFNEISCVPRTYKHSGEYRAPENYCPPANPVPEEAKEDQTWTCPRCNQEIDIDPADDDSDSCPKCKNSLWEMTCPQCGKDIWADSAICPQCQTELKVSKCPSCGKHLFVSPHQDNCPYSDCGEGLWICPRCQEYLNQDLDDLESCPICQQKLDTYTCPKCDHEDIFVDQQVCPGCRETLQFEPCPECGKVIPSDLEECPCCDEGLTVTDCPHCQKKHYIGE